MKKSHALTQGKAVFELKHKVVTALNKLADRDTHQIGVDDLDRTLHSLTAESIPPFLSCILDTDSDQKAAVRKECVRLMATTAAIHGNLVLPYLPKMVTSIVKRLRDTDSVVRGVCVETVGVLAAKLVNGQVNEEVSDRAFVALVRPIFEAIGEQNKHVQNGSAMCLARIVDNTRDPPISLLQKMLSRTLKLLKNQHFMAKPALVELNKSIIQGGGAPSENVLSTAIGSIQEALKDSDWATRKAASVALGEIGLSGAPFLACLRTSCIRSLESCRFDKVKPVRDAVLQALKYWRILPGNNTPEPSETGSSLKENICRGDSADLSSTTESGQRDVKVQKVNMKSTVGRVPLSARKAGQNYVGNPHHVKPDDWHVEIAVSRTHSVMEFPNQNEESESSSVTKPLETMSVDVTSMQDVGYEYVPMDDKQECSSVSNLTSDNFESKLLNASQECFIKSELQKPIARNQQLVEEVSCNEQIYSLKAHHPRSSGSTVTDSNPQTTHECCAQIANEMICIQHQLSDIEIKQSNMMHQFQMFTTGIMDAISTIQSRMVGLENAIDRLTQESAQGGRHSSYSENSKFMRQRQNMASPRFSTCTPRPSVDINNRQSGLSSVKNSESWEKKTFSRSQPRNPARDTSDTWKSYKEKHARNFREKDILNSSRNDAHSMISTQVRKDDGTFSSATRPKARSGCSDSSTNYWKCVKRLVIEGDLNAAYMEALCSNDELILVELLNKTGPVIESLSMKTINCLFSTLASYILEGRFFNTIIPWLQQVVEMSTIHGQNCIALSIEVKEQLLSAVQEAGNLNNFNHAERRCATELAMKLHHIWGVFNESS